MNRQELTGRILIEQKLITKTLKINGMTCVNCENRIEKNSTSLSVSLMLMQTIHIQR